jgi:hypothetical protein
VSNPGDAASKVTTASGNKATAFAPGRSGKARASVGGAIFLTRRDAEWHITHVFASKVGDNGIKPDTFYVLDEEGKPKEVAP